MKQDPTAIENAVNSLSPQQRANVLYERVATAMDAVSSLRKSLLAVASTKRAAAILDSEKAHDAWSALEISVSQLEEDACRVRAQGDALAASFLADGVSLDTPSDLEALVAAQRQALVALNHQVTEAASTIQQPVSGDSASVRDRGAVEIQDVNEFLQKSPIASIPVNASYYQRILEAAHATEGHKRPIGAILIEAGLITQRQLDNALSHQQEGKKRRPLGALLVDLGYATNTAIAQAIAAQLALPFVILSRETVRQDALQAIPIHLARRHACFPVSVNDGSLYVAMANPLDLIALEDLRLASGKYVRPCVASREEIAAHIKRHYPASSF